MKYLFLALAGIFLMSFTSFAQDSQLPSSEEDFKQQVLQLQNDVDAIQYNLHKSHNEFKIGIGLATLGYTVVIAGGLLLTTDNVDTGNALLITGGVIGLAGAAVLVDSFKWLGRSGGKYRKKKKKKENN